MTIGILKESGTENRIAMLPDAVTLLKNQGVEVIVERLAGFMFLFYFTKILHEL